MNTKNWNDVLAHLFVLCGIRKMEMSEHAMYVADMFTELKDKFTDEQICVAARQIAENENLYGNYPPLSVWLKYCPANRAKKLQEKTVTAKFMEAIDAVILEDSMVFDLQSHRKSIWSQFGMRASIALREIGGVAGVRRAGFGQTKSVINDLKKQILTAWNDAEKDVVAGLISPAEEKKLLN